MHSLTDYVKDNFVKDNVNGWRLLRRIGHVNDELSEKCCSVSKSTADFNAIVCGAASEVYRFGVDAKTYYFKEFLDRGWKDRIKNAFRGTRAIRALNGEMALFNAGLNYPPIVLLGEMGNRSFIVTEEVTDARDLYVLINEPSALPLPPNRFMKALGIAVGEMHAQGVSHGDLRWGNVLLSGDGSDLKIIFIDNERTLAYGRLPERLRLKNLVQMCISADRLSRIQALRFYAAYLQKNPLSKAEKRNLMSRVIKRANYRRARLLSKKS